jgi:hypothetical protein
MEQLPEKQINTTARISSGTIKASFCASVELTVGFQDKRSRTAFCSTFFPVRRPDGRKKVEEEKINLDFISDFSMYCLIPKLIYKNY